MFNAKKPSLDELPSSAQLIRSTAIAAASAVAILVTVVLPAEYNIDPTGIGGVLGLAEMGGTCAGGRSLARRDHLHPGAWRLGGLEDGDGRRPDGGIQGDR